MTFDTTRRHDEDWRVLLDEGNGTVFEFSHVTLGVNLGNLPQLLGRFARLVIIHLSGSDWRRFEGERCVVESLRSVGRGGGDLPCYLTASLENSEGAMKG